jgi:hypothetical protein
MAKPGPAPIFNRQLADAILERLRDGERLRSICETAAEGASAVCDGFVISRPAGKIPPGNAIAKPAGGTGHPPRTRSGLAGAAGRGCSVSALEAKPRLPWPTKASSRSS